MPRAHDRTSVDGGVYFANCGTSKETAVFPAETILNAKGSDGLEIEKHFAASDVLHHSVVFVCSGH